jgi:hypothetical protein
MQTRWFRELLCALVLLQVTLLVAQPARAQGPGNAFCGKFLVGGDGVHVYIGFVPADGSKPWQVSGLAIKPLSLDDINGRYAIVHNPKFNPLGLDAGQYELIECSSIELVESCAPTAAPRPTNTRRPAATWTPRATDTPRPTATLPSTPTPTIVPPGTTLVDISIKVTAETKFDPLQMSFADIMLYEQSLTVPVATSSSVWLKAVNLSNQPLTIADGAGQYTAQVTLNGGGKTTVLANVSSRQGGLIPLSSLAPGKSELLGPLYVPWPALPVDNATLQVRIIPDKGLGIPESAISKPITVKQVSPYGPADCLSGCLAAVLSPVADSVSSEVTAKLLPLLADIWAHCKPGQPWDSQCVSEQTADFAKTIWLDLLGMPGETLKSIVDAYKMINGQEQLYKDLREKGCLQTVVWLNELIRKVNGQGAQVNSILTQSPVYPLVVNKDGQRAGFLPDGQIVQEIPGAQVAQVGSERLVLYPGHDVAAEMRIASYKAGTMNVHVSVAHGGDGTLQASYNAVPLNSTTKATLRTDDASHLLRIDATGDGKSITNRSADVLQDTRQGVTAELPVPTPASQKARGRGICPGVLGLVLVPLGGGLACARVRKQGAGR